MYTKGKSAVSEQEGNAGLDGSGSGVEQLLKVYVQTSPALPKLQHEQKFAGRGGYRSEIQIVMMPASMVWSSCSKSLGAVWPSWA